MALISSPFSDLLANLPRISSRVSTQGKRSSLRLSRVEELVGESKNAVIILHFARATSSTFHPQYVLLIEDDVTITYLHLQLDALFGTFGGV